MNGNQFQPVECLQHILKSKEILFLLLQFQTIKQEISSIFCMANNEKYKVHPFEVAECHQPCGQAQHRAVFILTSTIIKDNI